MPIYQGGQKVTPRPGGVRPARVYRGDRLVYRSIIRVTPAAPTFLTASPWVTLPTVQGVTYSVSGTPDYGATVTVTATAQAGYELVGTITWTHTYPMPRYVASFQHTYPSGTQLSSRGSWTTLSLSSHTVANLGVASGMLSAEWDATSSVDRGVRVLLNGAVIAADGPRIFSGTTQAVSIPETVLPSGATLEFQFYHNNTQTYLRRLNSFEWSLS